MRVIHALCIPTYKYSTMVVALLIVSTVCARVNTKLGLLPKNHYLDPCRTLTFNRATTICGVSAWRSYLIIGSLTSQYLLSQSRGLESLISRYAYSVELYHVQPEFNTHTDHEPFCVLGRAAMLTMPVT